MDRKHLINIKSKSNEEGVIELYTVNKCLCCGSKNLDVLYGLVAPFIAQYVLKTPPFLCCLFRCKECNFRFFDQRFEDYEVEILYDDYRGFSYYSVRHMFEPWYSHRINDGIGNDQITINYRKSYLHDFLQSYIPINKLNRLLDYGGDHGQFIPDNIAENCYVFEVSGVDPIPGVIRIDNIRDLEKQTFDIVILSAVLEHVSDPQEILRKIHGILSDNGHLVIEVPYEFFYYRNWFGNFLTQKYLKILANSPNQLIKFVDFYSTLSKKLLHWIPPTGFVKLHEHINYFSENSFYPLLQSAGFSVIALEKHNQSSQAGISTTFTCLARVEK